MFAQMIAKIINNKAKQVLDNFWNWHLPVDVIDICTKMNIKAVPFNKDAIPDGVVGSLLNNGNTITIFYSPNESVNRKRFTVAFCLGCYLCNQLQIQGTNRIDVTIADFNKDNCGYFSAEANQFDLSLLMPKEAFDYLIFKEGYSHLNKLSEKLAVSELAVHCRLKELGFLNF